MSKEASAFKVCDRLVRGFENATKKSVRKHSAVYYTGANLGTACMVISVLDEDLHPVAGFYHYADAVRDGMVVDYTGAIRIVREVREELEKKLGTELVYTATAIPPGTDALDFGVTENMVQGTGFKIAALPDGSTIANTVLNIRNGAVVDVRGGTTGISVLKDGKAVYVADELAGGTHFSLVILGAYQLSFEEANAYKQDRKSHRELPPVLEPMIEKVFAIISRHVEGKDMDKIYLVGGTCCLTGIEEIIKKKTGIPTYRPVSPMFVTPLRTTKNCASACG